MINKSTFVSVAMSAAVAALPIAAPLQASDGASCIVSGSISRSCATTAYAVEGDMDSRIVLTECDRPLDQFESRFVTAEFGNALDRFRSDEPRGFVIVVH